MKKSIVMAVSGALMLTAGVVQARSGKEIYDTKCVACHAAGVANAPKLGDAAAWAPRAATGMDHLLSVAKTGKGAMPPMGTCMDCSDDEMKAVIQYMLDNSK